MFTSCEKKEDAEIETSELINTIPLSSVGNGLTGHIDNYFFPLEDELDVKFYLFNSASVVFEYEDYLALYGREPTQLTFKTYPQLIVSDTPVDLDTSAYTKITPFSPSWLVERTSLDPSDCPESLCNSDLEISFNEEGKVVEDSVALFSIQFKNVDKLVWEFDAEQVELQRYKPVNSDWLFLSDTIKYLDTLDIVSYTSVIQKLPGNEEAKFNDYNADGDSVDIVFEFNDDNDNGAWDEGEMMLDDYNVDGDSVDILFEFNDDNGNDDLDEAEANLFVDLLEWEKTEEKFAQEQTRIDREFYFSSWRRLGGDSLMFRINTDCNDDGAWTSEEVFVDCDDDRAICYGDENWADSLGNQKWNAGEEFTDSGNGVWDPAEVYVDHYDEGTYNLDEPYEDRNCNGIRDEAEPKDIGTDSCVVGLGGIWYDSESFCDLGNGQYDIAEGFTDVNDDGDITGDNELFIFGLSPNTLLVDWADSLNPEPMTTIYPGDSLTTHRGMKYYDIIRETDRYDPKTKWVDNVDSIVTQYNNKIIETVGEEGPGTDYYITKTEWNESTPAGDFRNYDYHIFKIDENIYKLVHPSYFIPYGYHGFTYDQISQSVSFSTQGYDNGFWYEPNTVDEVLYYTYNGLFRDGEIVNEEYYDTTSVGIYFVRKSQQVFSDIVTVPAKTIRGFIDSVETVQCYTEPPGSVTAIDECPAVDTTFNFCFKIIRSVNMTMIGSGVEWEEENTTWLVKDYGIVKTELKVRWGESIWFDVDDEIWAGYSRWEMGRYSSEPGDGGLLSKMLNPVRSVSLHSLDDVNELDNDPYQTHRTLGLHRIQFPVEH